MTGLTANNFFQRLRKQTGQYPNWNVDKFLISPNGSEVRHFGAGISPRNGELEKALRSMLQNVPGLLGGESPCLLSFNRAQLREHLLFKI